MFDNIEDLDFPALVILGIFGLGAGICKLCEIVVNSEKFSNNTTNTNNESFSVQQERLKNLFDKLKGKKYDDSYASSFATKSSSRVNYNNDKNDDDSYTSSCATNSSSRAESSISTKSSSRVNYNYDENDDEDENDDDSYVSSFATNSSSRVNYSYDENDDDSYASSSSTKSSSRVNYNNDKNYDDENENCGYTVNDIAAAYVIGRILRESSEQDDYDGYTIVNKPLHGQHYTPIKKL